MTRQSLCVSWYACPTLYTTHSTHSNIWIRTTLRHTVQQQTTCNKWSQNFWGIDFNCTQKVKIVSNCITWSTGMCCEGQGKEWSQIYRAVNNRWKNMRSSQTNSSSAGLMCIHLMIHILLCGVTAVWPNTLQPGSMQQHWPSTSPNKGMKHPESKHTACVISHHSATHPLLPNKAFHTPYIHSDKQCQVWIHVQCDGALLSSRVSFPSTVQILV